MGNRVSAMRRGLACAVVPALMLTGCTKIDSESSTDRLKPRNAVTIAANPASEEQMVLAEIYRQVLELADRQVGIVGLRMDTSEERLEALRQNDATLTVVCTGAVAESMNRAELKEIVASEGEDGSDTVKPMSEDMVNASMTSRWPRSLATGPRLIRRPQRHVLLNQVSLRKILKDRNCRRTSSRCSIPTTLTAVSAAP